jgi:hypothetical protein
MTTDQYRKALQRLGLNQQQAGRLLGISPRQASRLATGVSPISGPVERLILSWLEHGLPDATNPKPRARSA